MAKPRIINCADCDQPISVRHPKAKYCPVCRLVRDLLYVADSTRKCWLCEKEFAPITRHDALCGACCIPVQQHGQIDCAYCEKPGTAIATEVQVCTTCARDPKQRRKFVIGLVKKRAERKEDAANVATI